MVERFLQDFGDQSSPETLYVFCLYFIMSELMHTYIYFFAQL